MLHGVPESEAGWALPFIGSGVARVSIDYRVTLQLGGGDDIVLATRFTLTSPDGSTRLIDPSLWQEAAGAVALVHQIIRSARADRTGELLVEFHDGHSLHAGPSDAYEAWEIAFKDGRMIIALPGGEVTTFGANE